MDSSNPHSFSEVTHTSWLSRIGGAFAGAVIGVVLFCGSFVLLFWNEGRAVTTARSLDEGAGVVRSVDAGAADPGNDGALVHLSGEAQTQEVLKDPLFAVSVRALRLHRTVQMYQWQENRSSTTEKQFGGGTETVTTYDYVKKWSSRVTPSSDFRVPAGHRNPAAMVFDGQELATRSVQAGDVRVGGFRLADTQIAMIGGGRKLPLDEAFLARVRPRMLRASPAGGWLYLQGHGTEPRVGDLRVRFTVVPQGMVSVVAMQRGSKLLPYETRAGDTIELLQRGRVSAARMFDAAQADNTTLTWILRLAGTVMMLVGLSLVFAPLSVLADVIPPLGNLVEMGIGMAVSILATGLSILTIAIAWFTYRPLLSGGLLLAGVAVFFLPRLLNRPRQSPDVGYSALPGSAASPAGEAATGDAHGPRGGSSVPPLQEPPPTRGGALPTSSRYPLPGVNGLLTHAMIAGAVASGELSEVQQARILRQAGKAGILGREDAALCRALRSPWPPERLAASCADPATRVRVFGAALFAADPEVAGARDFLQRLAGHLDLSPDTVMAVRRKLGA
jgi:hypothetical protein